MNRADREAAGLPISGAIVLVTALLLMGCGSSRNEDEEEAVAKTVFSYIHAVVGGDGQAACESLTRPQARTALKGARVKFPELKARSCADALSKVGERLAPDVATALLAAPLMNIQTEDGKARAELIGGSTVIRLMRSDDRWLISAGLNLWTARHRPDLGSPQRTASIAWQGRPRQ